MPLITMPREMGSLGKDVAAEIAKRLGKSVVHHEIADQLANKMRLRKSHVVRFLEGKAGMWEKMTTDVTSLSIFTADEIFRIATSSDVAVIRGWGATHLLDSVSHVIRVRVCAPFETRTQRMMERLKTDDQAFVEKEIRLSEEAHGAITRRHFDVNWKEAEHYDLVLNTEHLSVESCTDRLMDLVKAAQFKESAESLQRLCDLALAANVRAALRNDERAQKVDITIEAADGHVTLKGVTDSSQMASVAADITATTTGVRRVTNHIQSKDRPFRRNDG